MLTAPAMTPRRHLAGLDLAAIVAAVRRHGRPADATIEDDHGRCLARRERRGVEPAGPRDIRRRSSSMAIAAGRVVLLAGSTGVRPLARRGRRPCAAALSPARGQRRPAPTARSARRRRDGARPRPAAAAQLRLPGAARGARLRPRDPVRGGARDRRRLLRPLPPAPPRPPAQPRHRRRHRQGHRGGPADGLLPAPAPRRDRPRDAARPRRSSGPTRSSSGSGTARCSSPPSWPAWTSRTGRLSIANAGHEPPLLIPRRRVAGRAWSSARGRCSGRSTRLELPESRSTLRPATRSCSTPTASPTPDRRDGERFDEARLFAAVERCTGRDRPGLVDEVAASIDRFAAGGEPADDITIVAGCGAPDRLR